MTDAVTNAMRADDSEELRAENERLRSGLDQMRDEVLHLGRALEAMHRLSEEVAILNNEAERLRAVAGELVAVSERSRAETAAERHRADLLARELAAVHTSTSWRLTRPVRWLARRLRGSG
jgi:hypothetical protein